MKKPNDHAEPTQVEREKEKSKNNLHTYLDTTLGALTID